MMALRSAALGMTVMAHDPFPDETFARENQVELVDFDRSPINDIKTIEGPVDVGLIDID